MKFLIGNGPSRFAAALGIALLVVVVAVSAFEAYVRWYINLNFTSLGGFELEALTIGAFALLLWSLHSSHAK